MMVKAIRKNDCYLGFSLGLLAAGEFGATDSKESKSTKLYLPERTWRALSLSSNAAPTFDLYRQPLGFRQSRLLCNYVMQWNTQWNIQCRTQCRNLHECMYEFGEHHPCLQMLPQLLTCRKSQSKVHSACTCQALSLASDALKG